MDMGYTESQARLAILNKMAKDLEKSQALHNHNVACEWVTTMGLPYRVSLDWLKADTDIMEIPLQRFYPMPQIPMVAELSQEEKTNKRKKELMDNGLWFDMVTERTGEKDSNDFDIVKIKPCDDEMYLQEQAEIERKAEEKAKQYYPWDLDTEQGKQTWEHLFAWRIALYEDVISTWNGFNMFGDNKHSDKELQERKAYYIDLVKRFKADTLGLYDTSPRLKRVEDYKLYDFNYHYMWRDIICTDLQPIEQAPKHPQALDIMYCEKEIEERQYMASGRAWELRCIDKYSCLYRINEIIQALEQANS